MRGIQGRPVRVGFYGTGNIARNTHIPILSGMDEVDVVALSDVNEGTLSSAREVAGVEKAHCYTDAVDTLEQEEMDVLFSCVPAYVRNDTHVEGAAAAKGIHIFQREAAGHSKRLDGSRARFGTRG